ncbi:MAG TPA: helix-turn-helix transcriptional regulator [Pyrinomonadaceae bacterium]
MKHWTDRSVEDFQFRVAADFVAQLEAKMEQLDMSQADLAKAMEVTEGRISQIINSPGNLTLSVMVKCVRVLGMKMSLVAYEDEDRENAHGPVDAEIFRHCWERLGCPRDFWALEEESLACAASAMTPQREERVKVTIQSWDVAAHAEGDASSEINLGAVELLGGRPLTASNLESDIELASEAAH